MLKNISLFFIFFSSFIFAENINVAQKANDLQFLGNWQVERSENNVQQLEQGDQILKYNSFADYPAGSGYNVAESKTFARIIVAAECGYALPGGDNYATHPISEVKAGHVLQKKSPEPHTMVVISVKNDEVTVVHCGWSAYQRVSKNIFPKSFLDEQGFKVFKTGVDNVKNDMESAREQRIDAQAFGSYRVVSTGTKNYHPISQGTIVSHSGPGGKIVVNETRTVSNDFSCNVGVKTDVISAGIGFSVTASFSRSLSYWRDVTPGKYGYVDLVYKYTVKNFDVYYKPFLGSEKRVGSGKGYKWQAVQFNYRESNN